MMSLPNQTLMPIENMKIYVTSSWGDVLYPNVVKILLEVGHLVYGFRNPPSCDSGFKSKHVNQNYLNWIS